MISSMDQEMEVSHCLVSHTTKHNAKSDATMGTTQKGRTNALAEHQQMELCTGATLPHLVKVSSSHIMQILLCYCILNLPKLDDGSRHAVAHYRKKKNFNRI